MKLKPSAVLASLLIATATFAKRPIEVHYLSTYTSPSGNAGAEISAFDAKTKRVFVTNAAARRVDLVDFSNAAAPVHLGFWDVSSYGTPNSIAVHHGIAAVAVEALVRTDDGNVLFFDASAAPGAQPLRAISVGAVPDMVTFTPDGHALLVANEGEPSGYGAGHADPEGSVSIIDLQHGVENATEHRARFTDFSANDLPPSVRIFGPGASIAQDLEPEYIAISHDSKTAWVTLQENNAVAILDIAGGFFTRIAGLGFKDHMLPGNALDPTDRDGPGGTGLINIVSKPVFGMYQPDAIAAFQTLGRTYLMTANEGDARDWPGFSEEVRVSSLSLDTGAFPDGASLKANANMGRLTVTNTLGDTDGDGDFDELYVFGARSFSIWDTELNQIHDSGDLLEQVTGALVPAKFNSNGTPGTFDTRSDNKGPEPEGLAVGEAWGRILAFVGSERTGGIFVVDITQPLEPELLQYVPQPVGDLAPEGLAFVPREESPTNEPLLIVSNEVSGTVTFYRVTMSQ
jgi:hypothetical protein